ncbi:ferulic acid esterase A faeA [Talaromyces proteolyticus]|uniref:Ferulic acid esterase A faeA n=1 Tax=Talaromyces proteolyticus TaxID=1131652 RepID=A0AAD4L2E0_9EURO|nr:ferulic acid esterase A faeA [Talaromyces proteolyticus]KAH8705366.1 ferulic acid esterase A faeA [Talaromyces proteolyticus]
MFLSFSNVAVAIALLTERCFAQSPGSPVSSDVWTKIVRYTDFASAAYGDSCDTPPYGSVAVQYFNDAFSDTHATLFRDDTAKEVIISFRGTASPKNLATDLEFDLVPLTATGTQCSNCKVHKGFQSSFEVLSDSVTSAIKSQLGQHSGYTFTVTGHSLGGGIAAIATSSFIAQGLKVANTFTFGEPRNGDQNWIKYISGQIPDANYYRVTHASDGVPQIPPQDLGYYQHGIEYWESQLQNNSASTTYNCGTQSTSCNAGQSFGNQPINGAHLTYTNTVIGSSLHIPACGATD